jgi:hypothetical protein
MGGLVFAQLIDAGRPCLEHRPNENPQDSGQLQLMLELVQAASGQGKERLDLLRAHPSPCQTILEEGTDRAYERNGQLS